MSVFEATMPPADADDDGGGRGGGGGGGGGATDSAGLRTFFASFLAASWLGILVDSRGIVVSFRFSPPPPPLLVAARLEYDGDAVG